MFERLRYAMLAIAIMAPVSLSADADGPDFFRVTGVSSDDVLNIRSGPGVSHDRVGQIPPDGGGVRNLGCEGGLSFAQWSEASEAERAAAAKRRWCQVEFQGVTGWVAGRYLTEGNAPVSAVAPGFDCTKAESGAQQAICSDPQLARLDLELTRLYGLAVNGPQMTPERISELKAMQRGWIKGRDACWKAVEGLTPCVAASYATRIDEIRTGFARAREDDGSGISMGPFAYVCEGLGAAVSMVVVNADPSILSLRWGDTWIAPAAQPAASGGKYLAQTAEGPVQFWIKGDEALLMRPGQPDLTCDRDGTG